MLRQLLVAVLALGVARVSAGAIALDHFEDGELSINLTTPSTVAISQTGLSTSSTFRGTRVGDFQLISGTSASLTAELGSASLTDGFLRLTTAPDSGARVNLTLIDEPSGFDLRGQGTAIDVFIEAAPSTPDTFMQFTDTSGRTRQLAINYRGAGTYRWNVPAVSTGFDPHAVALVTWRGTIGSSAELRVASITLVPEPASLVVLVGCGGALLLRRHPPAAATA